MAKNTYIENWITGISEKHVIRLTDDIRYVLHSLMFNWILRISSWIPE